MSIGALVLRNLAWFWRTNLAVVIGAAIAVSVLAGALLVGDSVRASLRRLALDRLGATDVVITGTTFVREALADDLRSASGAIGTAVPLIALDAVVSHAPSGRRAGPVHVFGVDDRFWRFHGVPGVNGPAGRDAFMSPVLAEELGASAGDALVVRVQVPSAIPSGVLQGRRDDTSRALRLIVRRVLGAERLGEFSLAPTQAPVRALFVPLSRLQRDLEQPGRVNAVLVAGAGEAATGDALAGRVTAALGTAARADDVGLKVIASAGAAGARGRERHRAHPGPAPIGRRAGGGAPGIRDGARAGVPGEHDPRRHPRGPVLRRDRGGRAALPAVDASERPCGIGSTGGCRVRTTPGTPPASRAHPTLR